MLPLEDARRQVATAQAEFLDAARARRDVTGEAREARARYQEALESLAAAFDQARMRGAGPLEDRQ